MSRDPGKDSDPGETGIKQDVFIAVQLVVWREPWVVAQEGEPTASLSQGDGTRV